MKITMNKILMALAASSVLAIAGNAMADSSYGYNSAGTGVSAKADVKIKVSVPELVVLRVGHTSDVDTVDLTAKVAVNTAPGAITADANNVGHGAATTTAWDAAVPTFSLTSKSLDATAWTNAKSVKLNCTSDDTELVLLNLSKAKVKVSGSGALGHPGANTACGTAVTITPNTLMSGTWTYSVDAADLAAATAGTGTQTTTYTAANI